jgi:hypothetical protein
VYLFDTGDCKLATYDANNNYPPAKPEVLGT